MGQIERMPIGELAAQVAGICNQTFDDACAAFREGDHDAHRNLTLQHRAYAIAYHELLENPTFH